MAKRPIQHIDESISRSELERVIPREWTINHTTVDYGIDCKVDVFKEHKSTPYGFYIQLKSKSENNINSKSVKFPFSTERIFDYMDSFLPVMLVVYDKTNNRLGYQWVNHRSEYSFEYIRTLSTQKTITLTFNKFLNDVKKETLYKEVISESLKRGLINPSFLELKLSLFFTDEIYNKYNLGEYLKWKDQISPKITIKYSIDEPTDGIIQFDNNQIISLKDDNVCFFKYNYSYLNSNQIIVLLKLFTSLILLKNKIIDSSLNCIRNIIYENNNELEFLENLLCLPDIAIAFKESNRSYEALKLAEILIQSNLDHAAMIFATSLINSDNQDYFQCQEFRRLLVTVIDKTANATNKGIYHYNMANNLRASGYFRASIKQYLKSIKLNKDYCSKSYWWSEIAGCFFLIKKYTMSNICYEKAIELNESKYPVKALNADALMYMGNYSLSKKILSIYLKETKYPIVEYQLKEIMLDHIKKFAIDGYRNTKTSLEKVNLGILDLKNSKQIFKSAIELDPLCGLAWFNFSICDNSKDRYLSWLTTSLIQNWDIEACCNTIYSLLKEFDDSKIAVLQLLNFYYYDIHKDEYIKYLLKHFDIKKEMKIQIEKMILESYENLKLIYDNYPKFEYRF